MLLLECVVAGSYTPVKYMLGLVYSRRFDYYNVSSLGRRSTRSIERSTLRRLHTLTGTSCVDAHYDRRHVQSLIYGTSSQSGTVPLVLD